MNRRATSLMEVLISIFIMALGLIALLTLFPVGAVTMGKAFQDDRVAQLVNTAGGQFMTYWNQMCDEAMAVSSNETPLLRVRGTNPGDVHTDVEKGTPGNNARKPEMLRWFPYAMDDPNAGIIQSQSTYALNLINYGIPAAALNALTGAPSAENNADTMINATPTISFPVYLDPVGWQSNKNTQSQFWFGLNKTIPNAIPRRTLCSESWRESRTPVSGVSPQSFTPYDSKSIWRNFFMRDDMTFDVENPTMPTGASIERAGRFSFAYLLRRNDNVFRRTPPSVWVVVYQGRSMESPSDEKVYQASALVPPLTGSQSVPDMPSQLHLSFTAGDTPAIRAGSWIMDATINPTVNPTTGIPTVMTSSSTIQGFFYRVADVSNQTATTMDVQLERPLTYGNEQPTGSTSSVTSTRFIVVPELVVHVAQVR